VAPLSCSFNCTVASIFSELLFPISNTTNVNIVTKETTKATINRTPIIGDIPKLELFKIFKFIILLSL